MNSSATAHTESASVLIRQHSSFKPNKKNLQRKAGGRLVLATREAERLLILGSYGVKVREGEATVAGAILTPSDDVQWVHAPHCHAVPILRTGDETILELQPHPAARGLRQMGKLNPSFAKLWNEDDSGSNKTSSTFQIDAPKRVVLQELVSPAQWNKKLSVLAAAKRKGTPVIFLCGPKSSGKSTFGRILANRLMTDRGGTRTNPWTSVMVLDLDPGQPEFSPPGAISLTKITTPNLSPSFCHPTFSPAEGQIRAHAIASVTPALDPTHFIECVLDLFAHYQHSPDAKCPWPPRNPLLRPPAGTLLLAEAINGTVLALVKVENRAALRGLLYLRE
ncbi:Polynucleotide 5'-hydroxyl-kinase grc3 [Collariella sp. IMI 366227]|nr:Polynucleotide 5'-hydroxyl-kinase grc3 [Collariella sp. IMI 366227]